MNENSTLRHRWLFCITALAVWLASGWPVLGKFAAGEPLRGALVPPYWLVAFAIFGVAVLVAMTLRLRPSHLWSLLCVQLAAVLAMTTIVSWAGISQFLVIIAWQAGMATTARRALYWIVFQTCAVIVTLAQALNPDLCWVLAKTSALQLLVVFAAQALRREAASARALAETNRELRSAHAIVANTVRNAERLRISRELHDAWGHELTALGLQLEIASHSTGESAATEPVLRAQSLARSLLAKVRDVVSTLREAEQDDLKHSLEALARSVPEPAIHVAVAADVRVDPEQAHVLIRCAQEAVTNTIRHANASNLWLQVQQDSDGVRLVAHDDGHATLSGSVPGSGLTGMRERFEHLDGRLAAGAGVDRGFTIDAWLPSRASRPA